MTPAPQPRRGPRSPATDAGDGSLIRYPNGADTDDASNKRVFITTSRSGAARSVPTAL